MRQRIGECVAVGNKLIYIHIINLLLSYFSAFFFSFSHPFLPYSFLSFLLLFNVSSQPLLQKTPATMATGLACQQNQRLHLSIL